MKRLLSDSPGMACPWPPTAENLNVSDAKSVVPVELYNLIAWIIGATEEPTLDCYVAIADDVNLKVLSICQDIVYLASKGLKQTPKQRRSGTQNQAGRHTPTRPQFLACVTCPRVCDVCSRA